jgi:hypothetical protein
MLKKRSALFFHQYIKSVGFVDDAGLELVSEDKSKEDVSELNITSNGRWSK